MDKFDLFFATLAGWALHPGYLREGSTLPTLETCAIMAEQMVDISDGRDAAIKEENS